MQTKKFFKNIDKYKTLKRTYFALIAIVLFFTLYHIGYAKKIVPGVRVGDIFAGGMSFDEALSAVSEFEKNLDKTVRFTYNDKTYEILPADINLSYDVEASVMRAFKLGRSGNFIIDTKDKLASLIKTIKITSYYSADDSALSNQFSRIRGEINQEAKDAKFILNEEEISVETSGIGRKVNDQKMYDEVIEAFEKMDFDPRELAVEEIEPSITENYLEKVRDEVAKIISVPLVVKFEDRNWQLSDDGLLDLVQVSVKAFIPSVNLNKAKFEAYMDSLAMEIDKLPRGKVTKLENGVVTGFELTTDGYELDRKKFEEDFKKSFLGERQEVMAQVNKIENLGDPSKYGIFALLGEGKSEYAGSIPGRISNLTLAAERTNGVLVPPGGVYSFNQAVGEINAATGYQTAYIISNGRTVLGDGGGVWQASTTLFRSILAAGLPVVERHPLAYRVSYYEQDRPVGFDASVYQPSLDLKFKNDTPNYVLVQSSADIPNVTLYFRLYGTPDGRQVEITEPVITNQSPPPETLYQDDPTLPKGQTRQVDWSAWGASVYFTRKVTKANGEVLADDTFTSRYQPWRAIFLKGTKD